jgi:HEPN domain-containing protein
MKKQADAWINFAEKDLLTVSEVIEKPELTNIVAFHCQQAIEKIFKAFILENGKLLVKTHNLLTLYGTIKEIMDFELDEDLLATVNDIYLESRYPGEIGLLDDGSMPTMEQAAQFFAFSKEVEAKIRGELNKSDKK